MAYACDNCGAKLCMYHLHLGPPSEVKDLCQQCWERARAREVVAILARQGLGGAAIKAQHSRHTRLSLAGLLQWFRWMFRREKDRGGGLPGPWA